MDFHTNTVAQSMADDPRLRAVNPRSGIAIRQAMLQVCRVAVSEAVLVTYNSQPPETAADPLTPDPAGKLVYLTPNP